jgi:hypothetical protein
MFEKLFKKKKDSSSEDTKTKPECPELPRSPVQNGNEIAIVACG